MPVVTFVDPDTVHNPASGTAAPASWFTTHEANFRSIEGRVCARIHNDTAEDFGPGATATISLPDTTYNNGMTVGSNAITVPSSYGGKYLICATARTASTTAGAWTVSLNIVLNGTSIHQETNTHGAGSNVYVTMSTTTVYALAVGDAVTMTVTTSATNPTDTDTEVAEVYPSIALTWLSA
jgi:hypothetical protein